ncbi:regulator of Ty1 Transposition [Coemansia biformis]|uniref:Regulator of Ty1 Transposition n=1 Tax=Coemansia biformis TaxID=1286918 RepID=A0A9W8D1L4_9FUNG|nr:regulator of Ty1 Transposition [Coemansia biformis]
MTGLPPADAADGQPADGRAAAGAPARRVGISFTEAEQQTFVRRADPVFGGVVFWVNPAFGDSECERPATLRRQGGEARRLNGVLVHALPQMASHTARFYVPGSRAGSAAGGPALCATHAISPDTHFGEYAACEAAGVRVVTSRWVERSAAIGWRYVERFFSPAAEDIFSGMVVHPTHMPVSDKETLLAAVMALGGQWRERMRADVTHLVLVRDEGPKAEYAKAHPELGIAPILPHWFKDTLNLGCRVPQEPYTFPNPPLLQGLIAHPSGKEPAGAEGGTAPLAVPSAETHNGNAYELPKPATQFLNGYAVGIDTRLRYSLSEGAIARLTRRLGEAGAQVVGPASLPVSAPGQAPRELPASLVADWECVDILLCQHREGYDYSKASRLGKIVGTLVWLYQAFLAERITPPTRRLLHYPAPFAAVPKMDQMKVTVSHYTGVSRKYLQCLIIAMGAEYTPQMTRSTTHLVTASPEGRKYTTAISWNIEVVNHFWVEQCFQRWKLLSVSHPMFTYFPQLPILNSMVGDTEVSVSGLEKWVDAPHGNSIAESSDMDVLNDSDLEEGADTGKPAAKAAAGDQHDALPAGKRPPAGGGGESGDELKSVSESADEAADDGGRRQQERDGHDQAGPLALGQVRHTSRAAAMAASKTLNEMMKAANIFETEMRKERLHKYRRGGGGKRTLVLGEGEGGDDGDDEGAGGGPAAPGPSQDVRAGGGGGGNSAGVTAAARVSAKGGHKRHRPNGPAGQPAVRIMFTQVRPTPDEQEQIMEMGGEIVDSATLATHLVCKSIRRTCKLLMALACGRVTIVGRNWMEDSLERREWIPVDVLGGGAGATQYSVVDHEAEEHWKFRLDESLRRAHQKLLLEGVVVYVTPHVEPPFSTLKPMIEIAGGEAVESLPEAKLQRLLKASVRVLRSGGDSARPLPLLVVTCKEDVELWPMFRVSADRRVPLYCAEVILIGLLRQRILHSSGEFEATLA